MCCSLDLLAVAQTLAQLLLGPGLGLVVKSCDPATVHVHEGQV